MLSYDEALARILEATPEPTPAPYSLPLQRLTDIAPTLAESFIAPFDLPLFDNSMVDGYAVCCADTENASPETPTVLPIVETISAGQWSERIVRRGEAVQVFTGAMVPQGADAIVMQEDTVRMGERVCITTPASAKFIRRAGSDIAKGEVAIPAGSQIGVGEFALLAAFKPETVPILHHLPKVAIITTGDEVIPFSHNGKIKPGQIYDTNGPALYRSVIQAGGNPLPLVHVRDSPAEIRTALQSVLQEIPDMIIASGGVSVGERDYIKDVVSEVGTLDFWRVAVKPGKPLAFGKIGKALFFGLPGNPVSSLVTFELFVRPVLRKLAGYKEVTRPQVRAILTTDLPHESGRREFVRAKLHWQENTYHATPTGAQGSHRLTSMVGANALLIAHEDHGDYRAGERLPALAL
jgi:molybdopterin molybdotransferase